MGESSRSGASLIGAGGSAGTAAGGLIDMNSKNFGATILGEAVNRAVTDLARQLESNAARLPTRVVVVEGLVAECLRQHTGVERGHAQRREGGRPARGQAPAS